MVRKVVTTLVVAGSVALGAAGTASAQPGPRCANASKQIARLQVQETHLATEVAALEARLSGHHHRNAWDLRGEVAALTREEARVAGEIQHLQVVCPGTGTSTTGNSGGGTTGTGNSGTGSPPTTSGSGGGTTTVGSTFAD